MIHVFLTQKIRSYTNKSWRAGDKISEVEAYNWEIEMGNTIQGRLGQAKYLSELRNAYKINYTPNKFY
ncbi:hypothetical protein BN1195_00635 [Chryseobacterium oranimense G311]|nr:hypothetical protein BN1195_00635 [Chryseobacterium oranimense G311]